MRHSCTVVYMLSALACTPLLSASDARAQEGVSDPNLHIDTYLDGLSQPTGMRFFGANEGFVIEKATGQVRYFNAGAISSTPLNLNVQNDNERGLLGIALDPAFTTTSPYVYLYYSATSASGDSGTSANWSGNQVVKYQWNGSTLTSTGITRTLGSPAGFANNGPNHNGGPLVFGSDGNLYGVTGDLNRGGVEQNNNSASAVSANVGGVYRLNTNLNAAGGNPFTGSFAQWYSYGVRNSFGLAVDPVTGNVWDTENGPESYDEINLIQQGMNGGWNKIQGPDSRDGQNAPQDLNMLPGAFYSDPEFSFRSVVAPTSIQFLYGSAWGPSYDDAVVVGDNNTGRLYLLRLNANRTGFVLDGDLADLVADNGAEAALLEFGHNFGTTTDLQIGPDGALYVTSLTDGKVYRIAPLPVPEPQTWAMFGVGLVLVSVLGWRRGKRRLSLA